MNRAISAIFLVCAPLCFAAPTQAQPSDPVSQHGEPKLGIDEFQHVAALVLEEMERSVHEVTSMSGRAARDRRLAEAACLDRKLTTMGPLHQAAEDAYHAFEDAVDRGERSLAEHQIRKITIALMRLRQLRADADVCLGMDDTGGGRPTVSYDGWLPTWDQTEALELDEDFGPLPEETSAFQ
jgi:hypothetical protein